MVLERSLEERIDRLVAAYGEASSEELNSTFRQISKRLGDQSARAAVEFVNQGNLADAARIALHYYDRTYADSLALRRDSVIETVNGVGLSDEEIAQLIISRL